MKPEEFQKILDNATERLDKVPQHLRRAEAAESQVASLTKERDEMVVRCHCCKGTQIWKRNEAGEIEVFHDCASGLHDAKEQVASLRESLERLIPIAEHGGQFGQVCNACRANSYEFAQHSKDCAVVLARAILESTKGTGQ